ncbi:MAG: hypothetical protein HFH05_10995 [Lachnospiraceae bacterium]|jgi:hypothetical protein|nr:hypothetical protein [Lachnospiraceae bacterium]MCI9676505.1 hypothetical protein [Lachnospiraceae bacterium]
MEFSEVINYILYTILTVILPVAAKYTVELIKAKIKESTVIANAAKNEEQCKIVKNALTEVMDAVLYVNQTYTDSLKANGKFDESAQKEAFQKAYSKALSMISEEAKYRIEQLYGSFDQWLKFKIESSVNASHKLSVPLAAESQKSIDPRSAGRLSTQAQPLDSLHAKIKKG